MSNAGSRLTALRAVLVALVLLALVLLTLVGCGSSASPNASAGNGAVLGTEAPLPSRIPSSAQEQLVTVSLPAIDVVDLVSGKTAALDTLATPGATLVWFWAPH